MKQYRGAAMDTLGWARIILLVGCLIAALISDVKENKIRNIITLPTALLGIGLNLVAQGQTGLIQALTGWLVPVLALIIFYIIRVMGAGDIKLFAAVGAVMGLQFTVGSFVLSIYFGGALALMLLIKRKQAGASLTRLGNYVLLCLNGHKLVAYPAEQGSKFPFALAIVPATLVQLLLWVGGVRWL